mmetsp:Transcript_26569/g.78172  ORF Transcript_26569/g.78172 Transcript_26569/m.78172 type:complete len:221 (+) Transcript_26569:122-784(+)
MSATPPPEAAAPPAHPAGGIASSPWNLSYPEMTREPRAVDELQRPGPAGSSRLGQHHRRPVSRSFCQVIMNSNSVATVTRRRHWRPVCVRPQHSAGPTRGKCSANHIMRSEAKRRRCPNRACEGSEWWGASPPHVEEDEEAEDEEAKVDHVAPVFCLRKRVEALHRARQESVGPVEAAPHVIEELVILVDKVADLDAHLLELAHLAMQQANVLIILLLHE